MLRLYPQHFRFEFGMEMQGVFDQLLAQEATRGLGDLALVFFKEMKDLPGAALREHWRGRKEQYMMENLSQSSTEKPAPGWAIAAVICLFLAPGILNFFQFLPSLFMRWLGFIILALLLLVPFGIGIFKRLPQWSLVYFGILTGIAGIYVFFTTLELLLEPHILRWMNNVLDEKDLLSRLEWQWFNQGRFWLGIILANALFLGLVALMPWFRPQMRKFWGDLSQLSFLFYGGILIVFFIDFDEYRYDEVYQLGCMTSMALGAWGYLRAGTPGRRTLALLAGLTGCMLIMGVGKYFLVPLQDWGEWFTYHAAESERWFESLRTIATWFWCALAVGLPGLIQVLRKNPPAVPQEIPQAA